MVKLKSGLERKFKLLAEAKGLELKYETTKFPYTKLSHYIPDWEIRKDVFVETKGYLSPSNRANLLAFKEQYPHVTILLMFGNSDNKLNKKSKTSYGEWCDRHGFQWADIRNGIPLHWWTPTLKEKDDRKTNHPNKRWRRGSSNRAGK